LAAAASDLNQLAIDTSNALSLQSYVRNSVDVACGTEHLAAIEALNDSIEAANGVKAALHAQIFSDFGAPDQPESIFAQVIEQGYRIDVEAGYTGAAVLNNEKPTVPSDCDGAVGDYND